MYFKFWVLVWELPKQGVGSNLGCPGMVCGHARCSLLMPQGSGSIDSFHLKMLWLNKDTGCALLSTAGLQHCVPHTQGAGPWLHSEHWCPLVQPPLCCTCGWLSWTACRRCQARQMCLPKRHSGDPKTVKIIPGCYICCITAHSFPVLCQHTIISASNLKELYYNIQIWGAYLLFHIFKGTLLN